MDFKTYVKPEMLVLIPVLYIIGMILKNTQKIDDRFIPAILGSCGMVLSLIWVIGAEGFSGVGLFTAITQGILCAGMAVYTNQLVKQTRKDF